MRKFAPWEYLTINVSFFGISFLWNSLHVILLPTILLLYVPDAEKNTYLGLLTGAGLIIAMVMQPLAGAVSDQWVSRWGRRRPMILAGTLLDFIFLGVLALAVGIPGLAMGYICLQFSSNMAHGPAQGLLPDIVPPERLGRVSAVKSVCEMLGVIAASLIMGKFLHADGSNWFAAIGIIMLVLAVALMITIGGSREESSLPLGAPRPLSQRVREVVHVDWGSAPGFGRLILARFIFLAGAYGVQAFALYFIRDVLQMPDPQSLTGSLMAAIAVSLTLCALGSGWLCDRYGRKTVHVLAAGLVASGSLVMICAHTSGFVLLCGIVIGSGVGVFLTSNWALAARLVPTKDAGKFLGLTNLATAGAGAVSRFTGPAIDGLNRWQPGKFLGYDALFACSAIFAIAGLLVLLSLSNEKAW